MDQGFNIIHLSDLQFGKPNRIQQKRNEDKDTAIRRFAIKISKSIIENLKVDQIKTSIILVTGDIANFSVKTEYDDADTFFDELIKNLNFAKERIVLIHGNHDINWKICEEIFTDSEGDKQQIKEIPEKYKYYKQFYDDFYNSIKIDPFDIKSPSYLRNFPDLKILVLSH